MNKKLRAAGFTILAAAIAGGIVALIIRSQQSRHRRDLFSPRALRRLAALGHMNREAASVENIRLLRDFLAWEPRRSLRERARSILGRMEREVARPGAHGRGAAARARQAYDLSPARAAETGRDDGP